MGCTVVQWWFFCLADLSDFPKRSLVVSPAPTWIFVSFVVLIFCASDMVTAMTPSPTFDVGGTQCDDSGLGNYNHTKERVGSQWSDPDIYEWIKQKFMLSYKANVKLLTSSDGEHQGHGRTGQRATAAEDG